MEQASGLLGRGIHGFLRIFRGQAPHLRGGHGPHLREGLGSHLRGARRPFLRGVGDRG